MSTTGYAADLGMEEKYDIPGTPLPPADATGVQRGKVAAANRQHGVAQYETVSPQEALNRMAKRMKGEMPAIVGGLDGPGVDRRTQPKPNALMAQAEAVQKAIVTGITKLSDASIDDEFGVEASPGDMDGFSPNPPPPDANGLRLKPPSLVVMPKKPTLADIPQLATLASGTGQYAAPVREVVQNALPKSSLFLAKRRRVTMEMSDSTVSMSIVDLIESRYGITVLVPTGADAAVFTPKPGSEVTFRDGSKVYECYFPGTFFDLPDLDIAGMSFVRKDDANAK